MKKVITTFAVMAMIMASCSVEEQQDIDLSASSSGLTEFSIALEMEDLGIDETKAYLNQGSSSWNYVWEDGDYLGFFQYRKAKLKYNGMAEVDKTPTSTSVLYASQEGDSFKIGDAVYSYLYQPSTDEALAAAGIASNNDPRNLYLGIPAIQSTNCTRETFHNETDNSFTISKPTVKCNGLSSYSISGTTEYSGVTPKDAVLKFRINGYNPDLNYHTSDNAEGLSIDYFGNATCTVKFQSFDDYEAEGTLSWNNTTSVYAKETVKIYVTGNDTKYGAIPVKVTAAGSGKLVNAYNDTRKLTLTYALETATDGNGIISIFDGLGDEKIYPVRNSMPCVSKQLTLSNDVVSNPGLIANAMTMYMLGSVAEFRVFSRDASVGVGEDLQMAIFKTKNAPCAGIATYDLLSEDFEMGEMTENTITSVFDDEFSTLPIAYGENNYVSLYLVLAPGTYDATVSLVTSEYVYTYNLTGKQFDRAYKKAFNCDLSSATCTKCTLEEFFAPADDEGGNEGSEEGGEDVDEPDGPTPDDPVVRPIPVMGSLATTQVSVSEVSGCVINRDHTGLLVVGDAGTLSEFTFGSFSSPRSILTTKNTGSADLEDVTIDPNTGDLYFAVERKQAMYTATYPDYAASSFTSVFTVDSADIPAGSNDGFEGLTYYKDNQVFVGGQTNAYVGLYTLTGEKKWGKNLKTIFGSSVISEVAGLCYDPESDWLWVVDSELFKLYIMDNTASEILATYDIKLSGIENPEGIAVDHVNNCIWIADDSSKGTPKLHKLSFTDL